MPVEITVPMLGDGMRDGVIAEWYAPDGADIKQGEPLYRLESNFVAIDIEAEYSGLLEHRLAAGTTHVPGSVVALIFAAAEDEAAAPAAADARPRTTEPPSAAGRPINHELEDDPADADVAPWGSAMAGWAHAGAAEREAALPAADAQPHTATPPNAAGRPLNRAPVSTRTQAGTAGNDLPPEIHELPGLRRGTLHAEPAPANSAWDAVEGDQEFDPGWQKPVEPERDVFGYIIDKDDETEERVSGVLGFSLGQHRRRILPAGASRPVPPAPAPAPEHVAEATVVAEPGDDAYQDDALPYVPSGRDDASGDFGPVRDRGGEDALPAMDWDRFEAPVKDPAGELTSGADDSQEIEPIEPIPFPVRLLDPYPEAEAPASLAAAALVLRVTVNMAAAREMQAHVAREWAPPSDEDIAIRALARATVESPVLRALGDDVGVVLLEPEGESMVVLSGASGGPLRDQVARLAEAKSRRAPGECAYTVTSFGALGIEDGTPPMPDGHPFALSVGAARVGFDSERCEPAPALTLTLAFSAEQITVAQAAMLLARVRDLMEAPHALLDS